MLREHLIRWLLETDIFGPDLEFSFERPDAELLADALINDGWVQEAEDDEWE